MSARTILRGGCVLTLGVKTPNYHSADVLIEDDRIVEVAEGIRVRDAEVVDATDTIVMPGFVDAHRHVWRSLFRNAAGAFPNAGPGPDCSPEDVYASVLVGLLGSIESGTTTVVDWADIPAGDTFLDAALQAHADSGIRSVYVVAAPMRASDASPLPEGIAKVRDAAGDLMSVAYGSSVGVTSGGAPAVVADWASAREAGLRIHAHAGLDRSDAGSVASLPKGTLLDDVTLVHCSHASAEDLDAVASAGAHVVLTPSTEMTDGMGAPPIQALLDRSIEFGLGVDRVAETPADLFAQMRATISLQHATYFDLKLAGKAGLPNMMTTRSSIRQATIQGAASAGLAHVTGSLEPGKQADIIMLRTDRPNIVPMNDPIGAVVWGMDTSNLDSVFVAGKPVMSGGYLRADVERASRLADAAAARILDTAAVGADTPGGAGS